MKSTPRSTALRKHRAGVVQISRVVPDPRAGDAHRTETESLHGQRIGSIRVEGEGAGGGNWGGHAHNPTVVKNFRSSCSPSSGDMVMNSWDWASSSGVGKIHGSSTSFGAN